MFIQQYKNNKIYKTTYWCQICECQVSINCGHYCFGNNVHKRDLVSGNSYSCYVCRRIVKKNCKHFDFGNKEYQVNEKKEKNIFKNEKDIPILNTKMLSINLKLDLYKMNLKKVIPKTYNKIQYWCFDCNKIITSNKCGHYCFGDKNFLIKQDQNSVYWCYQCKTHITSNECGHYCFGDIEYLRDLSIGKLYWCDYCKKQVSQQCVSDYPHSCFGDIKNLILQKTNRLYWCQICQKTVSKNCGHVGFSNVNYLVNLTGEKNYIKNKLQKQHQMLKLIRLQKKIMKISQ